MKPRRILWEGADADSEASRPERAAPKSETDDGLWEGRGPGRMALAIRRCGNGSGEFWGVSGKVDFVATAHSVALWRQAYAKRLADTDTDTDTDTRLRGSHLRAVRTIRIRWLPRRGAQPPERGARVLDALDRAGHGVWSFTLQLSGSRNAKAIGGGSLE